MTAKPPLARGSPRFARSTTTKLPVRLLAGVTLVVGLMLAVQPSWPKYRRRPVADPTLHCGAGWQDPYQQLHAAILRKASPPRFLRVLPLGDVGSSLRGLATAFYLAVLTERAILIDPGEDPALSSWLGHDLLRKVDRMYEAGFAAPRVDWAARPAAAGAAYPRRAILARDHNLSAVPPSVEAAGRDLAEVMTKGDVRRYRPDAVVLEVATGADYIQELFSNPYHKQQFFEWGLRPDVAVGCAFHYLFEPALAVQQRYATEFHMLDDNVNAFKIAVHVQLGAAHSSTPLTNAPAVAGDPPRGDLGGVDTGAAVAELSDDEYRSRYGHALSCAAAVEKSAVAPGQPVVWYLVSDSLPFRQYAGQRSEYRDKVLTRTLNLALASDGGGAARHALEDAAAELWFFQSADYQVTTGAALGPAAAAAGSSWASLIELPTEVPDGEDFDAEACLERLLG